MQYMRVDAVEVVLTLVVATVSGTNSAQHRDVPYDRLALYNNPVPRSVELQKANLEGGTSSSGSAASPLASAIPLAQLLSKSGALGALSSLSALGGLSDLLAGATPPVQTTGVHRSHKFPRRADDEPPAPKTKERNKYNPY